MPIIGLIKRPLPGFDLYITPELADVKALAAAKADIVAFDATERPRPVAVAEIIAAIHDCGCAAMADISTFSEGLASAEAGADLVATTLSGYTPYSPRLDGPDLHLIADLAAAGVPVIAEERIRTPAEARLALAAGASAITVGSAVTRPELIVQGFLEALQEAELTAES